MAEQQKSVLSNLASLPARAWSTDLGEGLMLGAGGALASRALASAAIRVFAGKDEQLDPAYYRRVRNAFTLLGAFAGLNPVVRRYGLTRKNGSDSFDPSPFFPTIDKRRAIGIVESDPFLDSFEKTGVTGLISRAPEPTGQATSTFGMVQAALRAGVTFVPAYAFGTLMGKALGVPASTARNISRAGALAYAVRASGLMEQLR